jgi:formiminotetrahydrofolate cyclodeaminase
MLADLTIKQYLEKTASNTAVPGGGSGAALSAAIAAGLVEMVANLTIGKRGFEDLNAEMQTIAKQAAELKEKLIVDIDQDAAAYNQVMSAFKLPNKTEKEKKMRSNAIQSSLKQAALVPLGVARDAYKVIEKAGVVVEKGNKNAITDGVFGAMLAKTAVSGALLNVRINLSAIKNRRFISKVSTEIRQLEDAVKIKEEEILSRLEI